MLIHPNKLQSRKFGKKIYKKQNTAKLLWLVSFNNVEAY